MWFKWWYNRKSFEETVVWQVCLQNQILMTRWAVNQMMLANGIRKNMEDTRTNAEKAILRKRLSLFTFRYDQEGNKI